MSTENQNPAPPDFWTRLGRTIGAVLRATLRVLFVIVFAILLGAGVYWGVPLAYQRLIQPVQSNITQVALLQRQVDADRDLWQEALASQQQRIASLEEQQDALGERVTGIKADIERVDMSLAAQQAALDELATSVAEAAAGYAADADVQKLVDNFASLEEQVVLAGDVAQQIDTSRYRLTLMQAWQELLRAQMQLSAGNAADARGTLELVADRLAQASTLAPDEEQDALADIQDRLATASARTRTQPILAAQDLENLWYEIDALIVLETPTE